MNINSYPTVFEINHKAIANLFDGVVFVEEKIDGSQISFGLDESGELMMRSKGKQLFVESNDNIFDKAIEQIDFMKSDLKPGLIYRCEYLRQPKHNTITYLRTPSNYMIGYDIQFQPECYYSHENKRREFERIGLETVPLFYEGVIRDVKELEQYLIRTSILGGSLVEGVVVKNYNQFTQEKKIAIGKFVRDEFKETHKKEWRKSNPTINDMINNIIDTYKTEARWQKSVQHLEENGELAGEPKDIGKLLVEVKADVKRECEDEIKDMLFTHFWPHIERGIVAGLPEWYKAKLEGNNPKTTKNEDKPCK